MKRLVAPSLAGLLLAGSLAGCSLWQGEPIDEAAYQAGYGPGCHTAQERQGSFTDYVDRDQSRFETDRSYRAGWNAGYHSCSRQNVDTNHGNGVPNPTSH